MLLIKQVAAVYHKIDADKLTAGQVRGFGRSLKAVGVKTKRVGRETYIDVRVGATVEGIIRRLNKERRDKKAKLAARKGNITGDVVAVKPAILEPTIGPVLDVGKIQLPLFDEPPVLPAPIPETEVEISKLLRTIERQAEVIEAQKEALAACSEALTARDAHIGSLEAQLSVVRNKLFNATVRKAVAEYGE